MYRVPGAEIKRRNKRAAIKRQFGRWTRTRRAARRFPGRTVKLSGRFRTSFPLPSFPRPDDRFTSNLESVYGYLSNSRDEDFVVLRERRGGRG